MWGLCVNTEMPSKFNDISRQYRFSSPDVWTTFGLLKWKPFLTTTGAIYAWFMNFLLEYLFVRINCHGTSTERDLKRLHQTATLQLQMARVFLPRFSTQFVLFIFLHDLKLTRCWAAVTRVDMKCVIYHFNKCFFIRRRGAGWENRRDEEGWRFCIH